MQEAALEDVKIGNIEYDSKMEEANKLLDEKNKKLEEKLKPITDPKTQDKFFRDQLWQYNKPVQNIVIAGFIQVLNGLIGPVSGMFIIKCIFSMVMFASDADKKNAELKTYGIDPIYMNGEEMREDLRQWILALCIIAFLTGLFKFLSVFIFGNIGQNITLNVRANLYRAILTKHVGWHDEPDNATGILSAVLAKDVQSLNGVSTEVLSTYAEAAASMLGGIIVAFCFTWQIALMAVAVSPLSVIGAVISSKMDKANAGSEDQDDELGAKAKKKEIEK
jgi:ABC-type multidrug transport system fused ATPase/permease subunit